MTSEKAPLAPAATASGTTLLAAAITGGVIAGFGELALLGWDKWHGGQLLFTSRDVLWMAPLGDVLYCALAIALLALLARGRPSLRALVFVVVAIAVAAWLLAFPTLHAAAAVVLAAGVGLQLARVAGRRPAGTTRLLRRPAPWLAGAVVALFLFVAGQSWWRQRALAPQGQAAESAPNVLLITLDTVRADSSSLYGYAQDTTPNLAALGKESVVFDRAISTAPWTLPSHAGMMTGRFHHEISANWSEPLDDRWPTLAEVLGKHGYDTAGFVANLNYCGWEAGIDRGFAHYDDFPVSLGEIVLCTSIGRRVTNDVTLRELVDEHDNLNRKTAAEVDDEFLHWLDGRDNERPWFAFLNFYDAHQPYLPPAKFADRFGPVLPHTGFRYDTNLIEIDDWSKLTPEQIRSEHASYDASIAYLDEQLGRLFEDLRHRGVLDETVVVIAGDHGEQFGEHGLYSHGNSLYLPSVHVPLLVRYPARVPAGVRSKEPVSLRDLPATIVDLTALDGVDVPGRSLARWWQQGDAAADGPDLVLSEATVIEGGKRHGESKSLLVGRYHYIKNGDGSEELYDVVADPEQTIDLAALQSSQDALERFRQALDLALADGGASAGVGGR